jgi:hypothetical protein
MSLSEVVIPAWKVAAKATFAIGLAEIQATGMCWVLTILATRTPAFRSDEMVFNLTEWPGAPLPSTVYLKSKETTL